MNLNGPSQTSGVQAQTSEQLTKVGPATFSSPFAGTQSSEVLGDTRPIASRTKGGLPNPVQLPGNSGTAGPSATSVPEHSQTESGSGGVGVTANVPAVNLDSQSRGRASVNAGRAFIPRNNRNNQPTTQPQSNQLGLATHGNDDLSAHLNQNRKTKRAGNQTGRGPKPYQRPTNSSQPTPSVGRVGAPTTYPAGGNASGSSQRLLRSDKSELAAFSQAREVAIARFTSILSNVLNRAPSYVSNKSGETYGSALGGASDLCDRIVDAADDAARLVIKGLQSQKNMMNTESEQHKE
jgi:hypothetical protein